MSIEAQVIKLEKEVNALQEKYSEDSLLLRQIHTAIIGDSYGNSGLNRRIENLEEWRLKFIWISGATTTASFVLGLLAKTFWQWLQTN